MSLWISRILYIYSKHWSWPLLGVKALFIHPRYAALASVFIASHTHTLTLKLFRCLYRSAFVYTNSFSSAFRFRSVYVRIENNVEILFLSEWKFAERWTRQKQKSWSIASRNTRKYGCYLICICQAQIRFGDTYTHSGDTNEKRQSQCDGYIFTSLSSHQNKNKNTFLQHVNERTKNILSHKTCKCSKCRVNCVCVTNNEFPLLLQSQGTHTQTIFFYLFSVLPVKMLSNCLSLFPLSIWDAVLLPFDDTFSCGIWYNTHSLSGFSALVQRQLGFSLGNIFGTLKDTKRHIPLSTILVGFLLVFLWPPFIHEKKGETNVKLNEKKI